jgi:Leucine-rich repeat (LRR) protein
MEEKTVKSTHQRSIPTIAFNIMIIMLFGLSALSINPAQVFAETSQQLPSPELLEIAQGSMVNYYVQGSEVLHFPLDVKDPQDGETYTWEVVHPLPMGKVSLNPVGKSTIVSYQPAPGFDGEDYFGVQVSAASGADAKINVLVTLAQQIDEGLDVYWQRETLKNPYFQSLSDIWIEGRIESQINDPKVNVDQNDNEYAFDSSIRMDDDPYLHVYPKTGHVNGHGWPAETEITLSIEGYDGFEWIEESSEWGSVYFYLDSFSIQPNQVLVMSGGVYEKHYTVSILAITEINEDDDIIYGIGGENKQIYITASDGESWHSRQVEIDDNGEWFADFSDDVDLGPGASGRVYEYDEQQNRTEFNWSIADPNIIVHLTNYSISGHQWPYYSLITLTIDGQIIDSQVSGNYGSVWFDLYDFNIQPGQVVVLEGGDYTRTHVVRDIAVIEFDLDNNIVYGKADPGSNIDVYAYDEDWNVVSRKETANAYGYWQAYFNEIDLIKGSTGWATQYDAEGNRTEIDWSIPDPRVNIHLPDNVIQSYGWMGNTLVTLTIDGQVILSRYSSRWGDLWINVNDFELQPGQEVVLTGGGFSCTHFINNITVTEIDQEMDIVFGTADAGSAVSVNAFNDLETASREVTADAEGNWQADFYAEVDITLGSKGWVSQSDAEGNSTIFHWYIPDPKFTVSISDGYISGYGWPSKTLVTLTIDGQFIESQITSSSGYVDFNLYYLNIQPAQIVMVEGGGYTRLHTVRDILVYEIDQVNDLIRGLADPSTVINVSAEDYSYWPYWLEVTVDQYGEWQADFSGILNIQKGVSGQVIQYDQEGNSTRINWFVPNPYLKVSTSYHSVSGFRWTPNALITLWIDDVEIVSKVASKNGDVYFYLGEGFIQPGQEIILSGGGDTRTHMVRNIAVTDIDQENDNISGLADPFSRLAITADDGWVWAWREVTADSDGFWQADFSGEADITIGTSGWITQYDLEGNATEVYWFVADPYFQVYLTGGYIFGYEWTPNSLVTLFINGVESGSGVSNENGRVFMWSPQSIVPGQVLVLDDGISTRTHIVKDIAVLEVNQQNKTVRGTAAPSSELEVSAHDGENFVWLWIDVEENGDWEVDFSPYTVKFSSGSYGWVNQYDDHGNSTNVRWYIPNPVMEVVLIGNTIYGSEWQPFAEITLFINGDEISTQTSNAYGRVFIDTHPIQIQPQMEITLTDGVTTRTHVVRDISITDVDETTDIVSGTADAGSYVMVIASNYETFDILDAQANETRVWQADFSGKVDIAPGTNIMVTQFDSQGNSTRVDSFIPDPYVSVSLNMNTINGRQWPPNTQLTLSILGKTWTEISNIYGNVLFKPDPNLIHGGQQITLAGGDYTVVYTIRDIVIYNVDIAADTVSGIAYPNSTIYIYACSGEYYCEMLTVPVDTYGEWMADFSGKIDLIPGVMGEAWQTDNNRNSTWLYWEVSTLAITSPDEAAFKVGKSGQFTITTSGTQVPSITVDGDLPAGIAFEDLEDGTATLSGTPTAGSEGIYPLMITASNGIDANATQAFTLTVSEALAFTSADSTTFTAGEPGSFTITTSGLPLPTLSIDGSLPGGLTFEDQEDGTAKLSGTPSSMSGGVYTLTITASNGVDPDVLQTFTLTINEAPVITSAASMNFTAGESGVFLVTTAGYPKPTLTYTGSLPTGVTLLDNTNGTATLSGTAEAGTGGSYPITIIASNGVTPDDEQPFTLTVKESPVINSDNNTIFSVGQQGTFTILTTGYPLAEINKEGVLPAGIVFEDQEDGTATLTGTPQVGSGGSYVLTITASNGVTPNAVQSFTLTVTETLTITSNNSAAFFVGQPGSFTITTVGFPSAELTYEGDLPAGISFEDQGNGSATLTGTPVSGSGGTYPLTLTASNGVDADATQIFTLTISEALSITSADSTTFTVGLSGSFGVTATGFPVPEISYVGNLPGGIVFTDQGGGTATFAGTPAAQSGGSYSLTITASNGVDVEATQSFTLNVNEVPVITSTTSTNFTVGQHSTFNITAIGFPVPAITVEGHLPSGLIITYGNGTATLVGTPAVGTSGDYTLTIGANNGINPPAVQTLTLTVNQAPAITSASVKSFTVGKPGVFLVTTTGYPTPALTYDGTLPPGMTFEDSGIGIAALYGTPLTGSDRTYEITVIANNSVGQPAEQVLTISISGFLSCQDVTTIPYNECEALVSLYASANGENWTRNDNWLETDDPGGWYGVTVENGQVTGLDLTSNNLIGSLEEDFFNFSELKYLTLTDNQLSGTISPDIGSLTSLVYLDLQSNKFNGEIPVQIGQLIDLEEIWLTTNGLSGPIPVTIEDLAQLTALGLGRNKLAGEIPAALGNLSDLRDLFLNDNRLTGNIPASLSVLESLERLSLRNNQLSGAIPEDFVSLVNLYHLRLDFNRLTVPAESEALAGFLEAKNPGWHLTQAKVETVSTSGGTVTSPDDNTIITVNDGSFEEEILFTFVPQPVPTQNIGNFGFAGTSFQLTAKIGEQPVSGQLDTPLIIQIYYDQAFMDEFNVSEESLVLYYWDENEGRWKDVLEACTEGVYDRNFDENWIKVPVCHLSEFSVLGEVAPTFTSSSAVTFAVGQTKTFLIETSANPTVEEIQVSGSIPNGLSLVNNAP